MKNRVLGRTGLQVGEIGLGCEALVELDAAAAQEMLNAAIEAGVNFFDLFAPQPQVRDAFGRAMKGRREKFILQAHLCSAWVDGQYMRTRDIEVVKAAFADLLARLGTDYVDVGMIHFVDEQKDFDEVFGGAVMEYAKELLAAGTVRHLGLSTHNPRVAIQAVQSGLIDVIMLSLNPAYDMLPPSEDINILFDKATYEAPDVLSRTDPERQELYALCESQGVALTVMKPYAGGALLDAQASPFGAAMTVAQCLHYCLTRPGVATVLTGAKNIPEMMEAIAYCDLPEEEKDYSTLLSSCPAHAFQDQCMYCGHCAPCPKGIDIASVTKFLNLCKAQGEIPETVREHYAALPHKAGECVGCGACGKRCPFGVDAAENMKQAAELFGA